MISFAGRITASSSTAHRALSHRVKKADRLQFVSEELEPQRPTVQRGIYIEHAAPAAQIAVVLNEGDPEKPALDQSAHETLRVGAFPGEPVFDIGKEDFRWDNSFDQGKRGGNHHEGRGRGAQCIEGFDPPCGCFRLSERLGLVAGA